MVGTPSRMSLKGERPSRMYGIGREALLDVREWSKGYPKYLGVVRRPSRMSEWLGDPTECPVVVRRISRMSGNDREAILDVQEWSSGPPGYPGVVWRPFRMSGSCREALPDVRELSGVSPGCPGVVGRPYQLSGSGGRPSRKSGSCRYFLPDVRELSGVPPGRSGGQPGDL